jgi:methylated-DNA-[protein]-cysteine S-methyltransferase
MIAPAPQLSLHTPVGDITLSEDDGALVSVDWGWAEGQKETALLKRARKQLQDYFDGKRQDFDLPLNPHGTALQKKIWAGMVAIPYGTTLAYGELGKRVGTIARVVGNACGRNPLPILIPCHRVLAAQGKLGFYSGEGGADTKVALLRLEGALL